MKGIYCMVKSVNLNLPQFQTPARMGPRVTPCARFLKIVGAAMVGLAYFFNPAVAAKTCYPFTGEGCDQCQTVREWDGPIRKVTITRPEYCPGGEALGILSGQHRVDIEYAERKPATYDVEAGDGSLDIAFGETESQAAKAHRDFQDRVVRAKEDSKQNATLQRRNEKVPNFQNEL